MRLTNIYHYGPAERYQALWELLKERPPEANISHKEMPTFEEHIKFVDRMPYAVWYFINPDEDTNQILGSLYLTVDREIGIAVKRGFQGKGIGKGALKELFRIHRGPFYANVAPTNDASAAFFLANGFEHIQNTYKIEVKDATGR
jgi:RimJ/RimL family protein N-acetyltransferase